MVLSTANICTAEKEFAWLNSWNEKSAYQLSVYLVVGVALKVREVLWYDVWGLVYEILIILTSKEG